MRTMPATTRLIGLAGLCGFVWTASGAAGSPTLGWKMPVDKELTDYSLVLDLPAEILAQLLGWPLISTVFGLSAGFFLAWFMERSGRRVLAILAIGAAMAVFVFSASRSITICGPVLSSKAFGKEIAEHYRPGDSVVILGDFWTARSIVGTGTCWSRASATVQVPVPF